MFKGKFYKLYEYCEQFVLLKPLSRLFFYLNLIQSRSIKKRMFSKKRNRQFLNLGKKT